MEFKDYLISLRWNSFSTYPDQWSAIYIHCSNDEVHKFVKVSKFNAVNFDFQKMTEKFTEKRRWQYSWLPAQKVDKDYDDKINAGCDDDVQPTFAPENNN